MFKKKNEKKNEMLEVEEWGIMEVWNCGIAG